MPYDEFLAERIIRILLDKHIPFEAKKMMGGICFMVNEKMCAGIVKNKMMARIDPELQEQALSQKGCSPMDLTGKSMRGFVFVDLEGTDMDKDLEYWIDLCLDYNPKAKSSKKKSYI